MHLLSMASCVLQQCSDGSSFNLSNVDGGSDLDLFMEVEEPVDLRGISVPSVTLHDVSRRSIPYLFRIFI